MNFNHFWWKPFYVGMPHSSRNFFCYHPWLFAWLHFFYLPPDLLPDTSIPNIQCIHSSLNVQNLSLCCLVCLQKHAFPPTNSKNVILKDGYSQHGAEKIIPNFIFVDIFLLVWKMRTRIWQSFIAIILNSTWFRRIFI